MLADSRNTSRQDEVRKVRRVLEVLKVLVRITANPNGVQRVVCAPRISDSGPHDDGPGGAITGLGTQLRTWGSHSCLAAGARSWGLWTWAYRPRGTYRLGMRVRTWTWQAYGHGVLDKLR